MDKKHTPIIVDGEIKDVPAAMLLTAIFAVLAIVALTGCTSTQLQTAAKYQSAVQAACDTAKAAAATPLATLALATVPNVAQAANLVASSCTTEEQIAALVNSPLSVAWIGTLSTTLKTGGKVVLPPPVAP